MVSAHIGPRTNLVNHLTSFYKPMGPGEVKGSFSQDSRLALAFKSAVQVWEDEDFVSLYPEIIIGDRGQRVVEGCRRQGFGGVDAETSIFLQLSRRSYRRAPAWITKLNPC
jgi:hypothetical protein